MKVKAAVVQYKLKDINDKVEFAEQIKGYVKEAMQNNPHFIVFPELITAQLANLNEGEPTEAILGVSEHTDFYINLFKSLSISNNVHIVGGSHIIQDISGSYLNRSYLFYPDGSFECQDKIHLTQWEKQQWELSPAEKVRTFDTKFGRVALLVCYDIEFPEISRYAMEQGANIVFCPSWTVTERGLNRITLCSRSKAIENQLFVVQTGMTGELTRFPEMQVNVAKAGIYSPCDRFFSEDGIIQEGNLNEEMVIFGEMDLDLLHESREDDSSIGIPLIKDMRKDMYSTEFKKQIIRNH
ncbi:carbon-nitrogen hydrolase family protein [Pontibacillus marinus]|uniref:Hydrolase n=1 Tax=Pontibacillus marinus BH030004 = DSM 16465 TaxID=1385511 RepID=A0A0A5GKT7_9BACI|nr:carbon-nitrogen hydrolase family protein [Pontibacillus marinus]KGX91780.1 hydrolase [Pontibacillus marinus BH030004 = DSM 16465]